MSDLTIWFVCTYLVLVFPVSDDIILPEGVDVKSIYSQDCT